MKEAAHEEGFNVGHKKGLMEGHKEGHKEALISVARSMIRRKRPIEEIIEDTGLTYEEINSLSFYMQN